MTEVDVAPDGSLASLHCEVSSSVPLLVLPLLFLQTLTPFVLQLAQEPYRRRGLAKAVAVKLMRERTSEYGTDGWGSADVAPDNASSQALCKSLNGRPSWVVSW